MGSALSYPPLHQFPDMTRFLIYTAMTLLAFLAGWAIYPPRLFIPDRPDSICYENTKPAPSTMRGEARLDAEARWQKLCNA